ncbi:PREDICTED: uncharacterized protein LOC109187360 [Ipomoea nil]|uniref:uncharacterized protein LOC109187360 n=1 Tax=Ipomoea nil TaxID=35883 RepID=UPI000900A6E7|nr:PREDICTED: uncharacterized protein LOC109187360 [Ipomoea nil]
MASRADSPAGNLTPTVTHRLPEDQDLLERSTKKSKRGRDQLLTTLLSPKDALGQDSPTESNQWRTPLVSPSNPWNRRIPDRAPVEEIDSDDDMEEDGVTFDYPVIRVTKEEKERLRCPWRRSLIVKVLGRSVGYSYLLQRLQRMWKTEAAFELIALNHDYFLVKFESLADYDAVKFGGPWMVLDHYLTTQQWRPNFDSRSDKLEKILAWIRFPSLPIEYFDDDFLKKIGDVIGRPLKIDITTSIASIGKFARVCVELDITKPLLSRFVLNWTEWPIEYEGIHQICFKCGIYGHRMDMCGKEKSGAGEGDEQDGSRPATQGNESSQQLPKEKYGSWMLVTRRVRRNLPRAANATGRRSQQVPIPQVPPHANVASNSRFGPLDGLEEEAEASQQHPLPNQSETPQQANTNLPRIRTNYRGTRQHVEQRE